ncbi:MAG: hypothetical protein ACREE1_16230 [Stellaceae bacterium]
MKRGIALLASVAVAGGFLAACAPTSILLEGDAKSATVAYGGDLAKATAVAAHHCASYERVPHFLMADIDTAYFSCVKP